MDKCHYTPEQERARQQAYAQRDGFATGFVRGWQAKSGGVSDGELQRARVEAKARYPIFASVPREVEDPTNPDLVWRVQNERLQVYRTDIKKWISTPLAIDLTASLVRFLSALLDKPDELVQTNE
jgi:hypothetical protein